MRGKKGSQVTLADAGWGRHGVGGSEIEISDLGVGLVVADMGIGWLNGISGAMGSAVEVADYVKMEALRNGGVGGKVE